MVTSAFIFLLLLFSTLPAVGCINLGKTFFQLRAFGCIFETKCFHISCLKASLKGKSLSSSAPADTSFFYWPEAIIILIPPFLVEEKSLDHCRRICVMFKDICLSARPWSAPTCPRSAGCSWAGVFGCSACPEGRRTGLGSLPGPASPNTKHTYEDG